MSGLLALLLVVGIVIGLAFVWVRGMSRDRVLSIDEAHARDVAIIFGAEMYPSGEPSPYLKARLDLGAQLYKNGQAKVLIVSGDNAAEHHHEATNMRRYLERQGVPGEAIVEDAHGLDTYDTCVRARDVFGVTDALLVSQRYHLSRAVATCRAIGVDAVGVADISVKATSNRWDDFSRRELLANVKMVGDLLTQRQPVLEPPSDAVQVALAR